MTYWLMFPLDYCTIAYWLMFPLDYCTMLLVDVPYGLLYNVTG